MNIGEFVNLESGQVVFTCVGCGDSQVGTSQRIDKMDGFDAHWAQPPKGWKPLEGDYKPRPCKCGKCGKTLVQ